MNKETIFKIIQNNRSQIAAHQIFVEFEKLKKKLQDQIDYSVSLQQSIEYHFRGEKIPKRIANQCLFHSEKLNSIIDAGER